MTNKIAVLNPAGQVVRIVPLASPSEWRVTTTEAPANPEQSLGRQAVWSDVLLAIGKSIGRPPHEVAYILAREAAKQNVSEAPKPASWTPPGGGATESQTNLEQKLLPRRDWAREVARPQGQSVGDEMLMPGAGFAPLPKAQRPELAHLERWSSEDISGQPGDWRSPAWRKASESVESVMSEQMRGTWHGSQAPAPQPPAHGKISW